MLIYGDNLDASCAVEEEKAFSEFSLVNVVWRCSRCVGMRETGAHVQALLDHEARGLARTGSLAVAFVNAPANVVNAFLAHLEADSARSEKFMTIIAEERGLSCTAAPTVLGIKTAPQLRLPNRSRNDYNLTSSHVCVAMLRVHGLSPNRAFHTCVALGKCISLTRDALWCMTDRIMVMCASADHAVGLNGIIPGQSDVSEQSRQKLLKCLEFESDFSRWFSFAGNEIKLKCAPDLAGDQVFFLFSFSTQLHARALSEMELCLQKLGIVFLVVKREIVANIAVLPGRK